MTTPRSSFPLVFIFCLALASSAVGQPGGGGDPGGGQPVPFSGLEILLTAGAALGVKSLYSLRKRKKNE